MVTRVAAAVGLILAIQSQVLADGVPSVFPGYTLGSQDIEVFGVNGPLPTFSSGAFAANAGVDGAMGVEDYNIGATTSNYVTQVGNWNNDGLFLLAAQVNANGSVSSSGYPNDLLIKGDVYDSNNSLLYSGTLLTGKVAGYATNTFQTDTGGARIR